MFPVLTNSPDTNSFLRSLGLSRATELARRGCLVEAEGLISELIDDPHCTKAATDLLARIRVRQGRFFEAQKLWMDVVKAHPNDNRSKSALAEINKIIEKGRWYGISRLGAVLAVGLIFVAGMTVATRSYFVRVGPSTREHAHASSDIAPSGRTVPSEASLDLGLHIAGVQTRADNAETNVRFESDLFKDGTTFRPDAAKLIEDLARHLQPGGERLEVIIEGYTDDIPVAKSSKFRDNVDLGNARAQVISGYLVRLGGVLPNHIFLRSVLSSSSSGDAVEQIRSRTVALRVKQIAR